MTEAHDTYAVELDDAIVKLNELVALLDWLEPSTRATMNNDWHIVSACKNVARNRIHELRRQVNEHVREREQLPRLPVDDD